MKEFDTAQVEQLKTIGDYLAQERQERAISLDEIAVKTYIPLRLLQALELGNVERLPEPVFVQGFIRRYAEAIGLDGAALAKTFLPQPSFVVERKALELERPNLPERPNLTEKPLAAAFTPALEAHDRGERPNRPFSNIPLVLAGTAAVLLLGVGLVNLFNHPKDAIDSQDSQSVAIQPSATNAAPQSNLAAKATLLPSPQVSVSPSIAQSPQASVAAPQGATDGAAPIQIAVNLTDESWLQVISDGKVEFEGTLKKGEQKTWKAKKTLVLQSGNAGAVSVSYNQGEAKVLGALGEVKDVTFPPTKNAQPTSTN